MSQGVEQIGKKDIIWSYAATIFMVGAGVLLLPFILNKMSAETVGIWNIFQTITSLVMLLDFGFRPSFGRNISYIFSGVKTLQVDGVDVTQSRDVDYSLLKGTLKAMRIFYRWIALVVMLVLMTAGSAYYAYILRKYSGDITDAWIAWFLLIGINCYNLYTMYYEALLFGKGYVKRSQQITIVAQLIYILVAIGMIYLGCGLTAIVGAQLLATIIRRILTYRVFFTKELCNQLERVDEQDWRMVLRAIYPNAIKVGLTHVGGFLINKSSILCGTLFLSLEQVACYGITLQVMEVLARCGAVTYQSYTPRVAQCRAEADMKQLARYYRYSIVSLLGVFLLGGSLWLGIGNELLQWIGSETRFVPNIMLCAMLLFSLLEQNHAISAGFIMADNKIPFFIPSLLSGAGTIALLCLFVVVLDWGMWGMILAPGLAQLVYQNWKWPSMIIQELRSVR